MQKVLWTLGCLVASLPAQTEIDLRTQSKSVNFAAAVQTTPWAVGTVLPSLCSVGQAFFNSAGAAGANVYVCSSLNQWTLASGGSGSGVTFTTGSGAPAAACTPGQNLYLDLTNQDLWFCESANLWKKSLSTTNSGPFTLTGQNGSSPGTAPTGNSSLFFNSVAKVGQTIDDGGNMATMVRPADCSTSSQLVQKTNTDGTVSCAAGSAAGSMPVVTYYPFAVAAAGNPHYGSNWWSDGNNGIGCDSGSPFTCHVTWSTASNKMALQLVVPHTWISGAVGLTIFFANQSAASQTITWGFTPGCWAAGAGAPSYNAQQTVSVSTSDTNLHAASIASLSTSGCSPDTPLFVQVTRTDTNAGVNGYGGEVSIAIP